MTTGSHHGTNGRNVGTEGQWLLTCIQRLTCLSRGITCRITGQRSSIAAHSTESQRTTQHTPSIGQHVMLKLMLSSWVTGSTNPTISRDHSALAANKTIENNMI